MSIANAISDVKRFVTTGGFGIDIVLTPPGGADPVTVKGITSRHHITYDNEGYPLNSTNSHVTLVESSLTDAGITVRNSRDDVALENFLLRYTDGTGTERTYKIVQTKPSETLGLIICEVGRYGSN